MDNRMRERLLEDREERAYYQVELMKEKGSSKCALVTLRINYPGIEKSNYITDEIIEVIGKEIKTYFEENIIYEENYKNGEGLIYHFIFNENPYSVKKKMVYIEENHILGRCVDLDVYEFNEEGMLYGLSRSREKIPPRRCFLCAEEAQICTRTQKHTVEEIKGFFQSKHEEYMRKEAIRKELAYTLSQKALKAMIKEVSTMPSYGLVSPNTMGSHKDMDYYTFLESSFAIAPYIKEMIYLGYTYEEPETIFSAIRPVGIKAEKDMLLATGGVNTHKGMIFLLGVVGAAVSKALYEKKSFEEISNIIKLMCVNILNDYKLVRAETKKTHGEELYFKYGITGIRGEVKEGLSFIFKDILPKFLSSTLSGNELYSHILLEVMAVIDDSTIVYRKDIETLSRVKKDARVILNLGGFNTIDGKRAAYEFERACIKDNISPGGAADLLAAIIFLSDVKQLFFIN